MTALRSVLRAEAAMLRSHAAAYEARAAELVALADGYEEPEAALVPTPEALAAAMNVSEEAREFLGEPEVCELLGRRRGQPIARSTLYAWRSKRGLPAPRMVAGVARYVRQEIVAWLLAQS